MKEHFNHEAFGRAVGLLIRERTGELQKKIDELESRLAAVEMTGLKYSGAYQRALQGDYVRGSVVTHQGSGWVCLTDRPSGAPGNSDHWQLFVKSGRT